MHHFLELRPNLVFARSLTKRQTHTTIFRFVYANTSSLATFFFWKSKSKNSLRVSFILSPGRAEESVHFEAYKSFVFFSRSVIGLVHRLGISNATVPNWRRPTPSCHWLRVIYTWSGDDEFIIDNGGAQVHRDYPMPKMSSMMTIQHMASVRRRTQKTNQLVSVGVFVSHIHIVRAIPIDQVNQRKILINYLG